MAAGYYVTRKVSRQLNFNGVDGSYELCRASLIVYNTWIEALLAKDDQYM